MNKQRCAWAQSNYLLIDYHDNEWGVPVHDDRKLFEFLLLDAFQAGLSWLTILKKRNNFSLAFDNFDYQKIAEYNDNKVIELLNNNGIIRNRLKISGTIKNARIFMDIQKEYGSFNKYIWQFTGGKTIINTYKTWKEIPASTKESGEMSKDLIKRGFTFVGSTICYSFMQAAGMVNDHEISCFRYKELI